MLHVPEQYRVRNGNLASDESYGNNGYFLVPCVMRYMAVIASDGEGWEHVSVSLKNRCPKWEEMCFIKNMFWDDEDIVLQFHPPKSEYVNNHPYCLHLWRPLEKQIPLPPSILVGIKNTVTVRGAERSTDEFVK